MTDRRGPWDTLQDLIDIMETFRTQWDQNGFVDSAAVSISLAGSTLTVEPAVDEFTYLQGGEQYTSKVQETIAVSDVEGQHWFYYDLGVLTEIVNPSHVQLEDLILTKCLVSSVYWDATNDQGKLYKENHGSNMAPATHRYLHDTIGCVWDTGLAVTIEAGDIDQDGSVNSHAQFAVETGVIYDEDLEHTLAAVDKTTGLEIWYLDGSDWRWTTNAGYSILIDGVTGGMAWNDSGSQTAVDNNRYALCHVFAPNSDDGDPIAIQGQAQYLTIALATTGAETEFGNLNLTGLPAAEMKYIGAIIFQYKTTYSNDVKSRMVSLDTGDYYSDFRYNVPIGVGSGSGVSDHGNLSGLTDDDHVRYVDINGGRDIAMSPGGVWSITDTDGDNLAAFTSNAGVDLYDNNVKMLEVGSGKVALNFAGTNTLETIADGINLPVASPTMSWGGNLEMKDGATICMYIRGSDTNLYAQGVNTLATFNAGGWGGIYLGNTTTFMTVHGEIATGNAELYVAQDSATLTLSGETVASAKVALATFDPDGASALGFGGTTVLSTIATGISITDGSATAATIGFTADDLYITNNDPDGEVYITAEKSGTGQSTILRGDPDGAITAYYGGAGRLATTAAGISITDGSATAATIGFDSDDLVIANHDADGEVYIKAEKSGAGQSTILHGDPDGAATMFNNALKTIETMAGGFKVYETGEVESAQFYHSGTNFTVTNNEYGGWMIFQVHHSGGSLYSQIQASSSYVSLGYAGGNVLRTRTGGFSVGASGNSYMHFVGSATTNEFAANEPGAVLQILGRDTGDTENRKMINLDPDGEASLYHAGEKVVWTNGFGMFFGVDGLREGGLYVSSNILKINSYIDSNGVQLLGNNSASASKILLHGDPDGATSIYYAGISTCSSDVNGIHIHQSVSDFAFVYFGDNKDSYIGEAEAAGLYYIRAGKNSMNVYIVGKDSGGANSPLATLDPDAGATFYYDGVESLTTSPVGIKTTRPGTSHTTSLYNSAGGSTYLQCGVDSAHLFLAGKNSASATTSLLYGDPDGKLSLYYDGSEVFWTTSEGAETVGGIKFPATQSPSSDVNTLDDYEEGTWTPVVYDASTGGNAGSATTSLGTYTKIGRQVTVTCTLTDVDTSGMTGANNLYVGGIPFARQTTTAVHYIAAIQVANVTFSGCLSAIFSSGNTRVQIRESVSGSAIGATIVSDLSSGSADIRFTISYEV